MVDFIAGCFGGLAGVAGGHPFDTVKVRIQAQDAVNPKYKNMIHCFTQVIKEDGTKALFKGITAPLLSLSLVNAAAFGVYGWSVRTLDPTILSEGGRPTLRNEFLAGCAGGFAQSFIAAPTERIKLLRQLEPPSEKRLPLTAFVKQHGVTSMFRGLLATIVRDTPAFGVYFATYRVVTEKMSSDGTLAGIGPIGLLLAGGIAGSASWMFNYPSDVIKTRFTANEGYKTYYDCCMKTYQATGWRGFWVGLTPTLVRSFPSNGVTFLTVEMTYRLFNVDRSGKKKVVEATEALPITEEDREPEIEDSSIPIGHDHSHKGQIMFTEFLDKSTDTVLPEAGSTYIDPVIHGSRFM